MINVPPDCHRAILALIVLPKRHIISSQRMWMAPSSGYHLVIMVIYDTPWTQHYIVHGLFFPNSPWNWGLTSQLWDAKPPKIWPLVSFTNMTVGPRLLQLATNRVKLSPCMFVENNKLQGTLWPAGSRGDRNIRRGRFKRHRSSFQGAYRHTGNRVGGGREGNPTPSPSPIRSSKNMAIAGIRKSQSSRHGMSHVFWSIEVIRINYIKKSSCCALC